MRIWRVMPASLLLFGACVSAPVPLEGSWRSKVQMDPDVAQKLREIGWDLDARITFVDNGKCTVRIFGETAPCAYVLEKDKIKIQARAENGEERLIEAQRVGNLLHMKAGELEFLLEKEK